MIIKLLVDGGDMKPGPTIGQKFGPLGINIGKVIQDVNAATKGFKGMQVPVELDVDPKKKTYTISVSTPSVSALLKKELGLESGSGAAKKIKVANISIEQLISIAKMKHADMLEKEFKSAVKSVIGTCVSMGILVENKEAKEVEKDIESGVYDKEIKDEKVELSSEKKASLAKHFSLVKSKQDELLKKEEEAKAAEEAAKAAAVTTTPGAATPAAGATPAAAATAPAAATSEKKPEAKKK